MKNDESKRFYPYYAVAFWTVCSLLLLLKGYLAASYESMETSVYTYFLGLLVLFFVYRRARG